MFFLSSIRINQLRDVTMRFFIMKKALSTCFAQNTYRIFMLIICWGKINWNERKYWKLQTKSIWFRLKSGVYVQFSNSSSQFFIFSDDERHTAAAYFGFCDSIFASSFSFLMSMWKYVRARFLCNAFYIAAGDVQHSLTLFSPSYMYSSLSFIERKNTRKKLCVSSEVRKKETQKRK